MNQSQFRPVWETSLDQPGILTTDVKRSSELWRFFILPSLLHVPLIFLIRAVPLMGLIFVVGLLIIGLFQLKYETPDRLIILGGYISSAELLWRMTNAPVFWETGKYLLVLLFGLGIIRWKARLPKKPLFYLLLMIPSALLTISQLSLSTARDYLSFNLSGPLLIGVAAILMSGIRLSRQTFTRLLLISIVPIVGIWVLAFGSMVSIAQIVFTSYSNFTTSGGYGPNQVSAVLGLGVLYCWLYHFIARPRGGGSWLIIGMGLGFLIQAVLTFSRGGVFNLAFAIPAAAFFFTQGSRAARQRIFTALILAGLVLLFLVPRLDVFTGGMLRTRYADLDLTGRDQIIRSDIQLWERNPVLGVGVGISSMLRGEMTNVVKAASHTEYTRLLAEHGVLGLLAILLLISMVWQTFRQAKGGLAKGTAVGLSLWAFAEMLHAGMRIAAISFVFALPLAILDLEEG